jgi:DNA-binding transcriptional regulator YdaS (Cro superfamily)
VSFQARLLSRALEICGSWSTLCIRLGVSEHSLTLWLEGRAELPARIFLKAADMVLEDDVVRAAGDRRKEPRLEPDPRPRAKHWPQVR